VQEFIFEDIVIAIVRSDHRRELFGEVARRGNGDSRHRATARFPFCFSNAPLAANVW